MREYETVFIFDAALDGEGLDKQIETVTSLIGEHKGNMLLEQRWGRRRLAYPIRKKSDGVYVYVRYEGDNALLSELGRRSKLNESILRFQTVALDHAYVQPVSAVAAATSTATEDEGAPPTATEDEGASSEAPESDAAASDTAEAPAAEKA